MNPEAVRETARLAWKLGLRVIPPREDGTKRPVGTWKQYQKHRPPREQMSTWYVNGHELHGIGLAMGDGIECLEFEDRNTYQLYRDTAEAGGLGDLIDRIEDGYMESTPGGGIHWLYYCDEVSGNTKLASRPTEGQLRDHWPPNVDVLIETRGEGGYVIIAPSYGPVHESGGAYELISGGLDTIATITPDERQELFILARAFDESRKQDYKPVHPEPTPVDGISPGNDYIAQTTWPEILEPHGWQFVFRNGETEYWRRPGKRIGISATINGEGVTPDRLYVFTSSTDFEPNRSYTRFQAYTFLEHNGDFSASAKDLSRQGYGEQNEGIRLLRSVFERDTGDPDDDEDADDDDDSGTVDQIAPRFRIYHSSEFITREPPHQLVRNVIVDRTHAALIGNSGTYKSFIALEMALRIANGGMWFGYPVEQGSVLYISGEGQASFGNRIKAWEIDRDEDHNIWILPEAIQFPDLRDIEDLLKAMDHYIREQPRLIVIDTLARSAVGKDENSSQDMGLYITGVDRIMKEYNCTALTLHHANKQGMYRGSSALRAAWDTVLESKQGDDGGSIILSCDKQKDLDPFKPIILRPDTVEVQPGSGLRPPVTSVVMQEESSGIITRSAKTILDILKRDFPNGTLNQPWENAAEAAGVKRRMFYNAKKQLANLGLIQADAGVYRPTGNIGPEIDYDN